MHFTCDGIDHLQCNVIITILTLPIEQWILQSVIEPIHFADTLKCVVSSTKHNVTTIGLITNNNCANFANGGSIVTPLMFSGWRSISSNDNRVIIWWLILRSIQQFWTNYLFSCTKFCKMCNTSLFNFSDKRWLIASRRFNWSLFCKKKTCKYCSCSFGNGANAPI